MKISVFTSDKSALTKRFEVVDGAINKIAQANFYSGTAETRGAATPAELLALLEGLTPQQALSVGVLKVGTKARITTANAVREGGPAVARTLEYFHFPEGQGWMLWDYDNGTMPPEVSARVEALGGPLAALFHIWPEAMTSPYLIRPSASGGVSAPGCPETQSSGLHGYFLIEDVRRSSEALDALLARAWADGLAWCTLSKAGSVLVRSIIDPAVGSPERLIFEAAPILIDPVVRAPKLAVLSDGIVPVPVPVIDGATAAAAKAAEAEARQAIEPEAERVEGVFIEDRAQEAAKKTGTPIEEARRIVREMLTGGVLSDDHLLQMKDGSYARVGDLLDAPKRFDRLSLPDPIEGLPYGPDKATLLLLPDTSRPDIQPRLVSHAHGVTTVYRFERYENLLLLPNAHTTPRRPADPPQLPSAPEARLQIDGAVSAFFGGVEGHHARSGIAALIAPEGTLDVVAAGVGLGKTTATIRASAVRLLSVRAAYLLAMEDYTAQVAAQKRVKKDAREEIAVPKAPAVMVLVPEHKLSEQTARNYRRSAPDLTVAVLRGVDANDPDAPGEKVCKRLDEYREAAALLLDPATNVCDGCPFSGTCKAIASKATKADVYIAAHGAMAGRPAALVKWREQYLDHVIVDEEPSSGLLFGVDGKRGLAMAAWTQARSENAQLDEVRAKLERAVAANGRGPLRREVLLAAWLSAEDAEVAAKAEWKRKVDDPQSEELDQNRTLTRAAGIWHEIVTFLQSGIEASGRLTVEHDIESGPVLAHRGVVARDRGWIDAPTLMLDATAEPEIISALMGMEPTRLTRIYAAEPMLKIRQDPSRSGAKSMLLEAKGASADGNRAARRKMARLSKYLQRLASSHTKLLLVISNKDVIAQLALALPKNGVTAHFGALRGLNDFEGIDRVVVIGRWMPSEYAVNARTAALFGVPVYGRLNTSGTAPRLARDRDGYYWHDGRAAVHSDQRADLVLRAIRDAEIEQAIGRVRAVNSETRVDVVLLSDAFVRQAVEVADIWSGVLKNPIHDMLDEMGIAVVSGSHAAMLFPGMWKTQQAAHKALRGVDDLTLQLSSYRSPYEESCSVDLVIVTYGQARQAARYSALVDRTRHPDPVAAVQAAIPTAKNIRLEQPPAASKGGRPGNEGYSAQIIQFMRGGVIDLNLAARSGPPEAELATADDTEAGQKHPEDTGEDSNARARHLPAEGANARVKGAIPAQALPAPPPAAVIVALPPRPDTDSAQPGCIVEDDDIACSIHGAEVVIFRRERPAEGRSFDRLRGLAEMAEETGMPLKFVPIDIDAIEPAPQASALRLVRGALPGGAALLDRLKERLPRTIYAPEAERHWQPAVRYAGAAG